MLEHYECWKDRTYIQLTDTELAMVNETEKTKERGNESGEEEELVFELV